MLRCICSASTPASLCVGPARTKAQPQSHPRLPRTCAWDRSSCWVSCPFSWLPQRTACRGTHPAAPTCPRRGRDPCNRQLDRRGRAAASEGWTYMQQCSSARTRRRGTHSAVPWFNHPLVLNTPLHCASSARWLRLLLFIVVVFRRESCAKTPARPRGSVAKCAGMSPGR